MQSDSQALIADQFPFVTILFTDLRGFTAFSSQLAPKDLVTFLNIMYTKVCQLACAWVFVSIRVSVEDAFCLPSYSWMIAVSALSRCLVVIRREINCGLSTVVL